ncbi:Esterase [Musa troglodytarum]|uniref:Esterase n=1 Tax=Musa troglodytarum TaxID=320322 RepID=A0A9E7GXY8_9LILI|nr:Esterase [Musa troglodytarum]
MGNAFDCMPKKGPAGGIRSRSKQSSKSRSQRKMAASEEELLHRQALAVAIQQHQLSQRFEGSMSRRIGSTSSRRRDLPDSIANGKLHPVSLENLETKKIILVHGEGFGAWCWYKTLSLLEEVGLIPIALDLKGSGIDLTDPNSVTTLENYSKPLTDYLHSLPDDEKVILVGHSFGGASVSYALECYPKKISKAVFLSATMVLDGQKPFDVFSDKVFLSLSLSGAYAILKLQHCCSCLLCAVQLPYSCQLSFQLSSAEVFLKESQFLVYGNGRDKPPTGLMFDKQQIKGLYFNQSPSKVWILTLLDIALAAVSMRPIPLAPIMEKLSLTPENYGTAKRFFIQTLDDHMLSPDVQEKLVRDNPPHGIYKIKGSDHCPFFSRPQALNKILLEIAQLP